ncbi:hypothetical protein KV692_04065 [Xanthomonas euvesicatoria pv. physalidis]|uniref:hypothetical protein n=1 Tax=Xanthomonas TaxID=338 RepID=UPI0011AB416D|nr:MULTISPECIES: hypothetical protein [Xanthomonas]MBV6687072.1 hypothetical protein [Xanthomonas euvesicatoria pv. physalidis]MBV6799061.1 hypothetical protein [Xanthomonas campestris pv. obscurae]QTF19442.1 hypothetical protein XcfCFBP6992P_23455 [Xanthomonas citri pv. phaseoli var. fuscans]
MSNKILRCGDDIDKSCHDIWLAVYTKEVTSQDQQRAEELAQSAVEKYLDRWVVDVPNGRDPQLYLNSVLACEQARLEHEEKLSKTDWGQACDLATGRDLS